MKRPLRALFPTIVMLILLGCDRDRSNPIDPQSSSLRKSPTTPTGLTAKAGVGRILLNWQPVADKDLAGYALFRAGRSDGEYEFISQKGDTTSRITTGITSFIDSLDPAGSLNLAGKTFYYRIAAVNTRMAYSKRSGFVGATVLADEVGPGAPMNLSAVPVEDSSGEVRLRWEAPRSDADGGALTGLSGYVVWRSEGDEASFVAVDTVGSGELVYVDTGLEELRRYGYRVVAFDGSGNAGERSSSVSVETGGIPVPSGLRARGEIGRVRLDWEASEERDLQGYNVYRSPRSDAGYERLEGVEGTPFTTGEISYVDSSVAPGARYFYRVTAVTVRRESGLSGFVGATVLADEVGPGAPMNLSAVPVEDSSGEVRLRWEAPRSDADGGALTGLSGYVVWRSEGEGASFVAVDTVGSGELVYVDTGLEELRRYGYRVVAFDGSGNAGERSSSVSVETGGIPVPSGLRARGEIGRVRLDWEASEERDLQGYNVYRSPRSDAGYERLEGVEGAPFTTGEISYVDSSVAPGARYFYRVTAVTVRRESGLSGFVGATVLADEVGPGAPMNLSAVPVEDSSGEVRLRWEAPRSDADGGALTGLSGYVVWRSEGEGASFVAVDTVGSGELVYVDTGLEELRRYGYRVVAFDGSGNAGERSSVSVETGGIPVPSGLRARGEIGRVRLDWEASEERDLQGYNVYRSPRSDAGYERLEGVEGAPFTTGEISYVDSSVAPGARYFYRVTAVTVRRESGLSGFVGATVLADEVGPGAPMNLSAVPVEDSSGEVRLRWEAPRSDADGGALTGLSGYVVWRSEGEGASFVAIDTVGSGELVYVDTGLEELRRYGYRVVAFDGSGNAGERSSVSVETGGIPVPSGLRARGEIGRVRLDWEASEERDLQGYNVYRSPRSDAGYERLEGVEGTPFTTGEISYVDSSVAPGARYFYRVTAVTVRRESGLSGFVGATVLADEVGPGAPMNLSAVPVEDSSGEVRLRWEAPRSDADGGALTGLSGYVVWRSEGEGASFVAIDTVGSGELVYVDTGLEELRRYGYRVVAFDGSGNAGERSSSVSVETGGIPVPSGLRARGEIGRVRLDWEASEERDLQGYNVYRSPRSDAGYERLEGVEGTPFTTGEISYVDSSVAPGARYFYRVTAVTVRRESGLSGFVGATVLADEVGPGAPMNLSAVPVEDSSGEVRLRWEAPRSDADGGALTGLSGYVVWRSEGEGASFVAVDTVGSGELVYVDTGLEELRRYGYRVVAFDGSGNAGERSSSVSVETGGIPVPSGLRARGEIGRVRLDWEASEERDLQGYNVYRSPRSDAGYERLEGVEGAPFTTGEISYVDSSVAPGARYFYRVTAVTVRRESGLSGFVGATVLADEVGPGAPMNLSAVPVEDSSGEVRLRWEAPRSDADGGALTGLSGYVVWRSEGEGASFVAVDTVGSGELVYVDTGLEELRRYGYRVVAFDGSGNTGERSPSVSVETGGIPVPSGLRARGEIGRVRLEWEASEERDLQGYNVYRSPRSDEGYERLEGVEGAPFTTGQITYIDSGLAAGEVFFYRVSALNSQGESRLSAFVGTTVHTDDSPPAVPTFLEGVPLVDDPSMLDITWTAPTTDAAGGRLTGLQGFQIYRSLDEDGPFKLVGTATEAAFVDTGLQELTTYFYQVEALDPAGNTSPRSATTPLATGGVDPPKDVSLSSTTPSNLLYPPIVTINWTAAAGAIIRYEVQRTTVPDSMVDGDFVDILPNDLSTTRQDDTVSRGETYYYRVRARDVDDRVSVWTALVAITVSD